MVLKIVLAVVGVLFLALAYPLLIFARQEPLLSMMFSLYVTLGVFLLLAVRNPSANRSLIAFTLRRLAELTRACFPKMTQLVYRREGFVQASIRQ
jgi:hypothetical protein